MTRSIRILILILSVTILSLAGASGARAADPVAIANGQYNVYERQGFTLTAEGSYDDGSIVEYAWDLDGNGTYDVTSTAEDVFVPWLSLDNLNMSHDSSYDVTLRVKDNQDNYSDTALTAAKSTLTIDSMPTPYVYTILPEDPAFPGQIAISCCEYTDDFMPYGEYVKINDVYYSTGGVMPGCLIAFKEFAFIQLYEIDQSTGEDLGTTVEDISGFFGSDVRLYNGWPFGNQRVMLKIYSNGNRSNKIIAELRKSDGSAVNDGSSTSDSFMFIVNDIPYDQDSEYYVFAYADDPLNGTQDKYDPGEPYGVYINNAPVMKFGMGGVIDYNYGVNIAQPSTGTLLIHTTEPNGCIAAWGIDIKVEGVEVAKTVPIFNFGLKFENVPVGENLGVYIKPLNAQDFYKYAEVDVVEGQTTYAVIEVTDQPIENVTLSSNPSGTGPFLTPVTWTATSSGGTAQNQYEFWMKPPNGVYDTFNDDDHSGTYEWFPDQDLVPGTYKFKVVVSVPSESGGTLFPSVTSSEVNFNLTTPLTMASCTNNKNGKVTVGRTVDIAADAAGGTEPYTYSLYFDEIGEDEVPLGANVTGWTFNNNDGDNDDTNSGTWDTTGWQSNPYIFRAVVTDAASDTAEETTYVYVHTAPEVDSITANPPNNAELGDTATFTASGTGGYNPYGYYYRFTLTGPEPGYESGQIVQVFDTADEWVWNTTDFAYGDYVLTVEVKDELGEVIGSSNINYGLYATPDVTINFNKTTCTVDNPVDISLFVENNTGPIEEYEIVVTNSADEEVYAYTGSDASTTWKPGAVVDQITTDETVDETFTVTANVRYSSGSQDPDGTGTASYQVYGKASLGAVTITPANEVFAGDDVTISVSGTGGSGNYEYMLIYIPDNAMLGGYAQYFTPDANGEFTWTTVASDVFMDGGVATGSEIGVNIRNQESSNERDDSGLFPYKVRPIAAIASFDKDITVDYATVGSPVTLTVTPAVPGEAGEYEYRYRIGSDYLTGFEGGVYAADQNSVSWAPSATGSYTVTAEMRSVGTSDAPVLADITINAIAPPVLSAGNVTPGNATPVTAGGNITFAAQATGGALNEPYGSIEYAYEINDVGVTLPWMAELTDPNVPEQVKLTVYARNAGTTTNNDHYDTSIDVYYDVIPRAIITGISTDKPGPLAAGNTVRITAEGGLGGALYGGGNSGIEYLFLVGGEAITPDGGFISDNFIDWNPDHDNAVTGTNPIEVRVRNLGSTVDPADNTDSINYDVYDIVLTFSHVYATVDNEFTATVTTDGAPPALEFRFFMKNSHDEEIFVQDYPAANPWTETMTTLYADSDVRSVVVQARPVGATEFETQKTRSFRIFHKAQLPDGSLVAAPPNLNSIDLETTFTANAVRPGLGAKYRFELWDVDDPNTHTVLAESNGGAYDISNTWTLTLDPSWEDNVNPRQVAAYVRNTYSTNDPDDSITIPYRIINDTTAPINCTVSVDEGDITNQNPVHLTLHAEDDESLMGEMNISLDGTFDEGSWHNYTSSYELTLPGEQSYTVSVLFRDNAGNEASAVTATVELDQTEPSEPDAVEFFASDGQGPAFNLNNPINVARPVIRGTRDAECSILINGSEFLAAGPDTNWEISNLPLSEGDNSVVITCVDAAGNESGPAAIPANIVCDTIPPVFSVYYEALWNDTDQVITGTREVGCTVTVCLLDEFNNCALPDNVTDISTTEWKYSITEMVENVSNKYRVTVTDLATNTTDKEITIIYDNKGPGSVDAPPLTVDGDRDGSSALLDWSSYDEASYSDLAFYRVYKDTSATLNQVDPTHINVYGKVEIEELTRGTKTYTAIGLTKGETYYFAVVPVDKYNNTDDEDTNDNEHIVEFVQATITDSTPPGEVTNLVMTPVYNGTGSDINLTWDDSVQNAADLSYYEISYRSVNDLDYTVAGTVPKNGGGGYDYTIPAGLANDTKVYVKVRATDDNATANVSPGRIKSVYTQAPAIKSLTASAGTASATLVWEPCDSMNVKSYNVYVQSNNEITTLNGLSPVNGLSVVKTGSVLKTTVGGLTIGDLYYFAVTPVNVSGVENKDIVSASCTPKSYDGGPGLTEFTVVSGGDEIEENGSVNYNATITVNATAPQNFMSSLYLIDVVVDENGAITETELSSVTYNEPYDQTTAGITHNWDIVNGEDGNHTIKVVAEDGNGNITEVERLYVVNLLPPGVPKVTVPGVDVTQSASTVTLSGTADKVCTVELFVDGEYRDEVDVTDGTFAFTGVAVAEGDNTLYTVARNRSGYSSSSETRTISVDTLTAPEAPIDLLANVKPGGKIQFTWKKSETGEMPHHYALYSRNPNGTYDNPVIGDIKYTVATYTQPDDTTDYYYAVKAFDQVGNASPFSVEIAVSTDSTLPTVTSGPAFRDENDQDVGAEIGAGTYSVEFSVSEKLAGTPFFGLQTAGRLIAPPLTFSYDPVTDVYTYTGNFEITALSGDGETTWTFTGTDVIGNRSNDEDETGSGPYIDLKGPKSTISLPNETNNYIPAGQTGLDISISFDEEIIVNPEIMLNGVILSLTGNDCDENNVCQSFTANIDTSQLGEGTYSFTSTLAEDEFGNVGSEVAGVAKIVIYDTNTDFDNVASIAATLLAGGDVLLEWEAVPGADEYRLYRDSTLIYSGNATTRTDNPGGSGPYSYSVLAVSYLDGEEFVSAVPATASNIVPDAAGPAEVADVTATVNDATNSVEVDWSLYSDNDAVSYSLYRTDSVTTPVAADLIAANLTDKAYADHDPFKGNNYYYVVAYDELGNASGFSAVSDLAVIALPGPSSLTLTMKEGYVPVLTWGPPSPASVPDPKYHIYRGKDQLTTQAESFTTFTDGSYAGGTVTYGVSVVDGQGNESKQRTVTYSGEMVGIADGTTLYRGLFGEAAVVIDNPDANAETIDVRNITFKVDDVDVGVLAGPVTVAPGTSDSSAIKVLAAPMAAGDTALVEVEAVIRSSNGAFIKTRSARPVSVTGSGPVVEILCDDLTKGTESAVNLRIFNSGSADMDILTREDGKPTNMVKVFLKDVDGNTLASRKLDEPGDYVVTIEGSDNSYSRIPPGGYFTTGDILLPVPEAAPNHVVVEAVVSNTYHDYGGADQIMVDGVVRTLPVIMSETSYRAVVDPIGSSLNDPEPVTITGTVIGEFWGTDLDNPPVPVVIGISVKGFDRYFTVTSDGDGRFAYTFTPGSSEAGRYSVWARHPDSFTNTEQTWFIIGGMTMSPSTAQLKMVEDGSYSIPLTIKNTGDEMLTFVYQQPDADETGTVTATVVGIPETLGSGKTAKAEMTIQVASTDHTPDVATVTFTLSSNNGPTRTLDVTVIVVEPIPLIAMSPTGVIDTSVVMGTQRLVTLNLKNTGMGGLDNAKVQGPATSWMALACARELGGVDKVLKPGESEEIAVLFRPDASVEQKTYEDAIVIVSDNHIPYKISIRCDVVPDAVGNVMFDVMNSFMEKVPGAYVRIQNTPLTDLIYSGYTKDADPGTGTLQFSGIPEGTYVYSVSASGCKPYTNSFEVLPNKTAVVPVALEVTLVEVEFTVTPVVIEDRYEIKITQTFKTNVPEANVVVEPPMIEMPTLEPGQVYTGQFKMTNYGLIEARDVSLTFPSTATNDSGETYTIELMNNVHDVLGPKQSVIVPFRVIRSN